MLLSVLLLVYSISSALAVNFDWENIQLTEAETSNYPAIRFEGQGPDPPERECRYIPGDQNWPSDAAWAKLNETLRGALLAPRPLAAVCYNGPLYNAARCEQLKVQWTNMDLHSNDPISVMSQWSSGSSCVTTSSPNSTCSQGGYPVYVVNATTVRHIQLAVNFARNQNIRLTIKNSGHDFNGKSIGGHALGVWVHNLKGFNYHANYNATGYSGRAVAYGGGFQSQESRTPMSRNNITIITAGGPTVGIAGGFLQAGGHSSYTSYYGMAADHVLSIQAVLASGQYVTIDAKQNPDLFWAFRGGGGGTYGIITSVVVKAFPSTPLASSSITFSTLPPRGSNKTTSLDTFWDGMREYWRYAENITDAGGLGYNFIRHVPNAVNSTDLEFTVSISMPGKTTQEYRTFIRPLLVRLNEVGVSVPLPASLKVKRYIHYHPTDNPYTSAHYIRSSPNSHLKSRALGDVTGNTLIASRFFARRNFNTSSALEEMHLAIRDMIDSSAGGYTFHGMNYAPTLAVSGNPDNAVNPAFRTTLMHAQAYEGDAWWDTTAPVRPIAEQKRRHDRLQSYMDKWKDITPGSGSYMNEGDNQEPDWKAAFYGKNYPRLRAIKAQRDPRDVFWAISAVGSDEWELRGSSGGGRDGVFTQDGRLCRA